MDFFNIFFSEFFSIFYFLDPIACYYIDPLQFNKWNDTSNGTSSFGNFQLHLCDSYVRRQIQLDILSRRQRRIVRVHSIMAFGGKGAWRFLIPGAPRNFVTLWSEVVGSVPFYKAHMYIIDNSWFFQTVNKNFMWMLPYSIRSTMTILDPVRYLDQLMTGLGAASLTAVNYLNEYQNITISPDDPNSNGNSGYQIIRLSSQGGTHEIAIDIDPNAASSLSTQVKWKFQVKGGHKVVFSVHTIEESEDCNGVTNTSSSSSSSSTRSSSLTPHHLCEIVCVQEQEVSSGEDSFMWTHHSKGLVLLRWAHPGVQHTSLWDTFMGGSTNEDIVVQFMLNPE